MLNIFLRKHFSSFNLGILHHVYILLNANEPFLIQNKWEPPMFCLIIDLFGWKIDLKNISDAILYHLICATYHTVTLDLFLT